ncbi:MAG: fibronectin type III domain-containing protein [Planctomycetia bacterium]|nr:fibronectin type III domain-containing protein [Planctomycetia bacterium]
MSHRAPVGKLSIVLTLMITLSGISQLSAQNLPPPTNLIAMASVPGDMAISLFWDDNSVGETGFEVQRMKSGDPAGFATIKIVPFNINSMNDVGLDENTTYIYRVRALSNTTISAFSNEASATTTFLMPAQITNLAGVYDGVGALITWTENATNETHIDVERVEEGFTAFEVIATLPPNSNFYYDTQVKTGTNYIYRVRPWRFTTATGAPDTVTVNTGPGLASPAGVQARPKTPTSIEISWRGRYDAGTTLQIQQFDLNTALWNTVAEVNANMNRYVDSGLQRQTLYLYRVRLNTTSSVSPWVNVQARTRP